MKIHEAKARTLPLRELQRPASGQVHVWFVQLQNLPVMEVTAPDDLKARLSQRRMGQKFLLRLLLGAYLGVPGRSIQMATNPSGKPALAGDWANSGLSFNLSHAGDWLVIAVADSVAVGIDIESSQRSLRWRKLSRRYFSAAEADWLDAMDDVEGALQFLKHWTAREALIKAMGCTIAGNISSVVLQTTATPQIELLPEDWPTADHWQLNLIEHSPNLIAHLACPQRLSEAHYFELDL
ncbi:MAG: 4'-phosphopantetheinyl transferase superfamily protein [Pseudomonadota bacterium]